MNTRNHPSTHPSRTLLTLGVAIAVLVTVAPVAAEAQSLIKVYGDKCLDVWGAGTANGSNVAIFGCHGNPNQQWVVEGTRIRNVGSNRCLDVWGGGTANATNVAIWDCHGNPNQQWVIEGERIRNVGSNRCLDIEGASSSDGANVFIYDCHGNANQRWTLASLNPPEPEPEPIIEPPDPPAPSMAGWITPSERLDPSESTYFFLADDFSSHDSGRNWASSWQNSWNGTLMLSGGEVKRQSPPIDMRDLAQLYIRFRLLNSQGGEPAGVWIGGDEKIFFLGRWGDHVTVKIAGKSINWSVGGKCDPVHGGLYSVRFYFTRRYVVLGCGIDDDWAMAWRQNRGQYATRLLPPKLETVFVQGHVEIDDLRITDNQRVLKWGTYDVFDYHTFCLLDGPGDRGECMEGLDRRVQISGTSGICTRDVNGTWGTFPNCFKIQPTGMSATSPVRIYHKPTDQCLSVDGARTESGAHVVVGSCATAVNWIRNFERKTFSPTHAPHMCLDAQSRDHRAQIRIMQCDPNNPNQQWLTYSQNLE